VRRIFILLCAVLLAVLLPAAVHAQTATETLVHVFCQGDYPTCTEGFNAQSGLIQASDGNFYGSAQAGGNNLDGGVIYRLSASGNYDVIYTFCQLLSGNNCLDGAAPVGPLTEGRNGLLYGVTHDGGPSNGGTIYSLTLGGQLTTLYSFCSAGGSACPGGGNPSDGLVQGSDGNFYGATTEGGQTAYGQGLGGTIFKMSPAGAYSVVYTFCSTTDPTTGLCLDGVAPDGYVAGTGSMVQHSNGNLYGTAEGGEYGDGVIFQLTPAGKYSVVYSFCTVQNNTGGCLDGSAPYNSLIEGSDASLYGVTGGGGQNGAANGEGGTIYKIGTNGKLTTLYSFCVNPVNGDVCPDGDGLQSGMELADGNFYGSVANGGDGAYGNYGGGYFYQMTPSGKLTPLYNFCSQVSCDDGSSPSGGLRQGSNGQFYGLAGGGTSGGQGGIFEAAVSPSLSPAVIFTANPATINFGKSTQLSWSSSSAYSETLQQCEAYYNGNPYAAVDASGLYLFTPPFAGTYHLAIICGGQQGGFVTVTALNPTQTVLTVTPNPLAADSKATLKAIVSQTAGSAIPTGEVQFRYGSRVIASGNLTGGVLSVLASDNGLPAGKYSIDAVYLGDGQNFGSTSTAVIVTVQ